MATGITSPGVRVRVETLVKEIKSLIGVDDIAVSAGVAAEGGGGGGDGGGGGEGGGGRGFPQSGSLDRLLGAGGLRSGGPWDWAEPSHGDPGQELGGERTGPPQTQVLHLHVLLLHLGVLGG